MLLHTGFNLWNQRKSDRKKVNCKALVSFHDPSKIRLPPHLTSQVSASFSTITWLSSTINCSCDMWECLAQRFWYGNLKYNKIIRHKKPPVLEKCVCHLWLLLAFKPEDILEMKQHILWQHMLCLHAKRTFLLCCYLVDRKWVTFLNDLFSGLIASVPSNWIVWETLVENKDTSGRWLLSKNACSGMDAVIPQPESHAPVLPPAWRYTNHTIMCPFFSVWRRTTDYRPK